MSVEKQREKRRESFDEVAALYDAARPGYPEVVFDDLVRLVGLKAGSRVLEIGSGTGHATLPLAQRGLHIDGIELGAQMAAVARAKLAEFPDVAIAVADFDTWQGSGLYELVFSASAYHWLNPATRVPRIAERLAAGGHVATIRNFHVQGEASGQFNAATQPIHAQANAELLPQLTQNSLPRIEDIEATDAKEWEASGVFSHAQTKVYHWSSKLSAEEYVQMLDTHSDHRVMAADVRERLFSQLRSVINDEFGCVALKEYVTLLQIAEKAV